MIKPQELSGVLLGGASVLLAIQPAWGAATPVTAVRLNPTETSLELTLETKAGADSVQRPQIFTISRGNELRADLLNTQLRLPKGKTFQQENPMPGITSVVVTQMDANSIRVIVKGANNAPKSRIIQGTGKEITFSFSPTSANQVAQVPANKQVEFAQTPTEQPTSNGATPETKTTNPSNSDLPKPDVLVPNPEVAIDGKPASTADVAQPIAPAPPFLPRAVAPPVGDIAISNVDSSATAIDLGTATRVPRLVLRDAPVREVLGLLARSAGLNLAYTGAGAGTPAGAPGAPGANGAASSTISLDIENEPVQNVFNYVLQLSGLQANRSGNTIFVGSDLPQGARDIITRTFRLNQVTASAAAGFLSAQGAESQQVISQTVRTTTGEGADRRTTEQTTTTITPLAATKSTSGAPLLLTGLSVLTDNRLNAITLVGAPRQIEVASSFLTQLDARRRQVAVNVKIVDVNLLNTDQFNTSFSFGVGDNFFTVDQGAAVFNFGNFRPPTAAQATGSTISPAVINNPYAEANIFLDPSNTVSVQGTTPGVVTILGSGGVVRNQAAGAGAFPTPFVNLTNPLQAGFTDITPATDTIITETIDPATGRVTRTTAQGTNGTVTSALPSLFQFPKRFLSQLQAQIQSGNAKILTDPTLVVQEGQSATVNLTQEVFGGFQLVTQAVPNSNITSQVQQPIIKQAGLTLQVAVDRIDDNGFVTMGISPTVSAPTSSTNTAQGQIVLTSQRQLQSGQIRLRDGQTLILSGIIQESDRTTVSKVPILGDIPLLGSLFRSTNRQNQRNEVIVLVTPQVLDDSDRASFGYNYTPSPEVRQWLQKKGFSTQGGN